MYYNVTIEEELLYVNTNQMVFHFQSDLETALSFCKMILKTSEYRVKIIPNLDTESEESEE